MSFLATFHQIGNVHITMVLINAIGETPLHQDVIQYMAKTAICAAVAVKTGPAAVYVGDGRDREKGDGSIFQDWKATQPTSCRPGLNLAYYFYSMSAG